MRPACLSFAVFALVAGCLSTRDPAAELEDRLYSPCCYRQSLRDHESPIATELRAEIETRVAAGEPVVRIEKDIVRRYGEQIRSLPKGEDPRWLIALVAVIASLAGVTALVRIGRRRRPSPLAPTAQPTDDEDDRLDDELALVD